MFHGGAVIDELPQRVHADADMVTDEVGAHFLVAFFGLDTFRSHGFIGYQQQGSGGNLIIEAHAEQGRGFHIHCQATDFAEVGLEFLVMFPDAAVGGIDGARPVVVAVVEMAFSRLNAGSDGTSGGK